MAICAECGARYRGGKFIEPHKPWCSSASRSGYSLRSVDPVAQPKSSEHLEQCRLIAWCDDVADQYPDIDRIFAIPNGGHRHKAVAGRMKAEGVKAGVPDLFLPVPRGIYAGLFIEMKYGTNKPTENQREWIEYLARCGYLAQVCNSFDSARRLLIDYYEVSYE